MDCFRSGPNDLTLKPVIKPFEACKRLYLRLESGQIQICSRKGSTLESIPLDQVKWYPCALPEGRDHCLAFQYKSPQTREIYLKACSRAAVAHLASQLDKAARLSKNKEKSNGVEVHIEASAPPSAASKEANVPKENSAGNCPQCLKLAEVSKECEILNSEIDNLKQELSSCRVELEHTQNEARKNNQSSAEKIEHEIQQQNRIKDLEECLREAADRVEGLLIELQSAKATAHQNAHAAKELESRIAAAEEEKKCLVDALTTAQAQLYDAQVAFKETSSQLACASKCCSTAKAQATSARADLDIAKEEALRHELAAMKAQKELEEMVEQVKYAKQQLASQEKAWASERGRMEGTISALKQSAPIADVGVTQEELIALKQQILVLKDHIARSQDGDAAAQQARRDLEKIQRELVEQKICAREEAESLRSRASVAEKEAQSAKDEARIMQERLVAALSSQAAAVQARNELESKLDSLKIELERVEREKAIQAKSAL